MARSPILLASRNYPPYYGGTSLLLYDILRYFPQDALVAVTGVPYETNTGAHTLPFENVPVRVVGSDWLTPRLEQRRPRAFIERIKRVIRRVVRERGVERIWAHYPNDTFCIAGYEVARELGLPLTLYMDILWEESSDRWGFGAKHEREIVQYADQHYAITEAAVTYLSQKHGVRFDLVPHTIDATDLAPSAAPAAPYRIHFAGGIYPNMNQDSVRRMAEVVSDFDGDVVFDIYSNLSADVLEGWGVDRSRVRLDFVTRDQVRAVQRASSVLFLPQAFESGAAVMVEYNYPTKALEYMVAGRPILVHSPPESYLTLSAVEHEYAYVVAEPDAGALEEGLRRVIGDAALQRDLVQKGIAFAETRDARTWAARFQEMLGIAS